MQINGYEIAISEEKLDSMINSETLPVELINSTFAGYQNLSDGNKKALQHLMQAGRIMNDVALEQDHPLNRSLKKVLETASPNNTHAYKALKIFNSINGVTGLNGVDAEPIQIFKGVSGYKGGNFYPADMSVDEFHKILKQMISDREINEVKKILSARSMVRRNGDKLKAIDYTVYFAKEFSIIANELEVAAHYADNTLFKEYLGWQAQALLQNNEDMDMLADKHWAKMQDTELEFTISRENYEDEMTPTIFENEELRSLLEENNIEVVSKDMLGIRVGIINKNSCLLTGKF